jgi:dTDP-4-amino-4,6-dideoxygalactose transaminase
LATSEQAVATTVVLPLFHQMTVEDQDRVIESLARACLPRAESRRR